MQERFEALTMRQPLEDAFAGRGAEVLLALQNAIKRRSLPNSENLRMPPRKAISRQLERRRKPYVVAFRNSLKRQRGWTKPISSP